jgi:glycerate kinase
VRGPLGGLGPASVLLAGDTAYVESAQACGLHLLGSLRDPERASTYGVGQLVLAALEAGARRIVVGLGGSGTNDGGAGLLAALGATSDPLGSLEKGPAGLAALEAVDLRSASSMTAGVEIVAATDVDNPLLGLTGATNVYGTQKGVSAEGKHAIDAALGRLADLTGKRVSRQPGAGAAGGLGFALFLLGAVRRPGIDLVAETVGLPERVEQADLVVTGEGSFDFSSRSGKVPYGVARLAGAAARPCIVVAGSVLVGSREMRALGVESAYSAVELVGEGPSFADPAGSLSALAARVARTWSRPE